MTTKPTIDPLSEEILRMVHAFDDAGRKDAVRAIAARVRELESRTAALVEAAEEIAYRFPVAVSSGAPHPMEKLRAALAAFGQGGDGTKEGGGG